MNVPACIGVVWDEEAADVAATSGTARCLWRGSLGDFGDARGARGGWETLRLVDGRQRGRLRRIWHQLVAVRDIVHALVVRRTHLESPCSNS